MRRTCPDREDENRGRSAAGVRQELVTRLDDEARLAILRLKDAWHTRPECPDVIGAFEIYEAVLEQGVRTPEQLEQYLGGP